jgi:hypothetical protein
VTGQRPAWYEHETQAARLLENECGDDAARQLAATRAIGYALLAAGERLGGLLDAADDGSTQLEQIRQAVEMLHREPRLTVRQWFSGLAWRWWGARRAERAWRAQQPPLGTAVLAGEEIALVWQAVKDAAGRCGDERLAAAYADLLALLAADDGGQLAEIASAAGGSDGP